MNEIKMKMLKNPNNYHQLKKANDIQEEVVRLNNQQRFKNNKLNQNESPNFQQHHNNKKNKIKTIKTLPLPMINPFLRKLKIFK